MRSEELGQDKRFAPRLGKNLLMMMMRTMTRMILAIQVPSPIPDPLFKSHSNDNIYVMLGVVVGVGCGRIGDGMVCKSSLYLYPLPAQTQNRNDQRHDMNMCRLKICSIDGLLVFEKCDPEPSPSNKTKGCGAH